VVGAVQAQAGGTKGCVDKSAVMRLCGMGIGPEMRAGHAHALGSDAPLFLQLTDDLGEQAFAGKSRYGGGNMGNDGDVWHSHWVVLVKDEACGAGGLKVQDIAEGAKPALPKTWPGLPLLIDSPGYAPAISGDHIEVSVPAAALGDIIAVAFDGVTSGLQVNASTHAPLLCVAEVFDIASGDLSLPGKISK
jgi:hypothetical protein